MEVGQGQNVDKKTTANAVIPEKKIQFSVVMLQQASLAKLLH